MNIAQGEVHSSTLFPYQVNVSTDEFDNVSIAEAEGENNYHNT
jgi:hypothetical protein